MSNNKQLTTQSKLIGEHPSSDFFFDWFECEDTNATDRKKHRKLTNKGIDKVALVNYLAQKIIGHHYTEEQKERIEKKKEILNKHGLVQYVERGMKFPIESKSTQKGNLSEIILAEYLTMTSGLETLVHKLRYNPNVEQSMKGDYVLLFDKKNIQKRLIIGEAKFRTIKSKKVLYDIIDCLSNKKLPISLPFVKDILDSKGEYKLAEEIDDLIANLHNGNTSISYVGFYHSDSSVYKTIESNLDTDNEDLVIISYGDDDPAALVNESYEKAKNILEEI